MSNRFVHLRVHSEYSISDGLGSPKAILEQCQALGMQAIGLTDNTNFYAAIKWYRTALSRGIKPILGADIWIEGEERPHLITLLCQSNRGYLNLIDLISKGYLESRRENGVPLIQRPWLEKSKLHGLIAISGGVFGDIGQSLLEGQKTRAETWLKNWIKLFPDNRFYLELTRTQRPNEETYIEQVLPLAQQHQVPVVATQDVHFPTHEEFEAHEIRVAIHDGYLMEDQNRRQDFSPEQYLYPPDKMCELFSDIPQAIDNSIEISKRCNLTIELDKPSLPRFPVPEDMDETSYLSHISHEGLQKRFATVLKDLNTPENQTAYKERLEIELSVIASMGFPGYFLIVADFIRWAKEQKIPVGPGRGSGAGSLVAYALEITDINPIPYDLLFERFLNPERVSMPDFDIDFCMDGRDRVIEYVAETYGKDAVSQIITFGTMAAKAVVRDVGRVLGHGYGFVDSIAKLVPFEIGMTLTKALEDEPKLKQRCAEDPEVQALIDMALKLEGTVRNVGKHAGGVVIAPSRLTAFTPIYCEEGSQQIVSQYDKNDVEAAGLVKFDFLGLRNLTIIDNALRIVNAIGQKQGDSEIRIEAIPLDDQPTFDLLKRCETTAVFQLESRGMKDLIKRLQPDSFEDIIALVALFRPGPLQSGMVDDFIDRKHGRAELAYPHPATEAILEPTYGIILYQEQVMQIAQVLAGYTLGGADLLRRAMGKKKPEEMAKQREVFLAGAIKNEIDKGIANAIFDLMEKFAGYGFNKSHSAAYALVAYQTAWLKAHYPAPFMAAVLSSDMDNTDKVVTFTEDATRSGIAILPPHINTSLYEFTVEENNIRFGLGAIKGVGQSAIEHILEERTTHGAFKDLFDFCERVDLRKVNKRVVEALIDGGALDTLHENRESMLLNLPTAFQAAEQSERAAASGQHDLFSMESGDHSTHTQKFKVISATPISTTLREKAVLGIFLTDHPMKHYQDDIDALNILPLKKLKTAGNKKGSKVVGIIHQTRRIRTKNDTFMRAVELDDGTRRQEILFFGEELDRYQHLLKVDDVVVIEVEVRPDHFTDGVRVTGKSVTPLEAFKAKQIKKLRLAVSQQQADSGALKRIKQLFHTVSKTGCPIEFLYQTPDGNVLLNGTNYCVELTEDNLRDLYKILPEGQVEVVY